MEINFHSQTRLPRISIRALLTIANQARFSLDFITKPTNPTTVKLKDQTGVVI